MCSLFKEPKEAAPTHNNWSGQVTPKIIIPAIIDFGVSLLSGKILYMKSPTKVRASKVTK